MIARAMYAAVLLPSKYLFNTFDFYFLKGGTAPKPKLSMV